MVLDPFSLWKLGGVYELGSAHLDGPVSLVGADIDGNDAGCTNDGGCGDNPETNGAASKDGDAGILCDRAVQDQMGSMVEKRTY